MFNAFSDLLCSNYAGIIGWSLVEMYVGICLAIIVYRSYVRSPNLDLSINDYSMMRYNSGIL